MNMVSSTVVEEAKKKLEDAQMELVNDSEIQQSIATINEIFGTLSNYWDTGGSKNSLSKIGSTVQDLEKFSELDSLVSDIKSATIIYNHTSPIKID